MTANNSENDTSQRDHNPNWFGYFFISCWSTALIPTILTSIDESNNTDGLLAIIWASVSLTISIIILLFDRIKFLNDILNIRDKGNTEGYVLLFIVIFWIVGVSFITRANGLAYKAMNIYVMAWGNLFASIHALNQYLASKDIISITMLTRLSDTLSGWYWLLFSSLVSTFSAINMIVLIGADSEFLSDVIFAVILGAVSVVMSVVLIFIHYKIISCPNKGYGIMELVFAIVLAIFWLVGVVTLTSGNGIAPTIVGTQSCACLDDDDHVPGSNLYVSTWGCFLSSCYITLKWKKVKAMNLAAMQDTRDVTKTNNI